MFVSVPKARRTCAARSEKMEKDSPRLCRARQRLPSRLCRSGARDSEQEKGNEAAIPLLETAIKLDPKFASALFRLGLISRNSGQEARARQLLTKALALRPRSSPRYKFNIAGLYYSFVTAAPNPATHPYRQCITRT